MTWAAKGALGVGVMGGVPGCVGGLIGVRLFVGAVRGLVSGFLCTAPYIHICAYY